jgi:CspA family cold shock protein
MGLHRCLIFHITPKEKKTMNEGKVKFFNVSKGFGFITQDVGEDLFFHVSELRATTAKEGDRVEYEIGEGRKGPCAINVQDVQTSA